MVNLPTSMYFNVQQDNHDKQLSLVGMINTELLCTMLLVEYAHCPLHPPLHTAS